MLPSAPATLLGPQLQNRRIACWLEAPRATHHKEWCSGVAGEALNEEGRQATQASRARRSTTRLMSMLCPRLAISSITRRTYRSSGVGKGKGWLGGNGGARSGGVLGACLEGALRCVCLVRRHALPTLPARPQQHCCSNTAVSLLQPSPLKLTSCRRSPEPPPRQVPFSHPYITTHTPRHPTPTHSHRYVRSP